MNVAVIDDSAADRFLARRVIAAVMRDADITEYALANEALGAVQAATAPLLVFLDINMPGMDGFGFLDRVEPQIANAPVCVVMLTSSGDPADRQRAAGYHCVKAYVEKPLSGEQLRSLLGSR